MHRPRNPAIFEAPKFIGLTTSKRICIVLDEEGLYTTDATYVFKTKDNLNVNERFALAVLNSNVFQFLYEVTLQGGQRIIPQVKAANLYNIPFPIKPDHNVNTKIHDEIVKHVETMLELNKELQKSKPGEEQERLKQRITYTDKKIDALVYELYGLTEEEIKVVEGA